MSQADGPGAMSLACAALGILVLLASGWWTDRTYRRFDRLPGHYDLAGRATRLDPRPVMAWLLPVVFSLVIALITALVLLTPPERTRGDPSVPLYVLPILMLAAQASVLTLLRRWAARQP